MNKLPSLLIITAGILWGTLGIYVRHLSRAGLESLEIVALRAVLTLGLLVVILLVYDRNLLKIKLKDSWCFFGTGICSILLFNYCYFKTITLTSLAVAAILLYTAPALVAIMSCFLFKEHFTGKTILALLLSFSGCALVTGIFGAEISLSLQGLLTGLGAGFGYGLYSIFSRYALQKGYHSLTITTYTFVFASFGVAFMVDFQGLANLVRINSSLIWWGLGLSLLATVLPYICYTSGLSKVAAGKASIIASIEPVVAMLLGVFTFHEKLTITSGLGVTFVILALVILQRQPAQT